MQHLGHCDHAVKAADDLLGATEGEIGRLDVDHQLVLVALQAADVAALRHDAEQREHIQDAGQRRGLGGGEDGEAVNPSMGRG
jgi:hypothetical protein